MHPVEREEPTPTKRSPSISAQHTHESASSVEDLQYYPEKMVSRAGVVFADSPVILPGAVEGLTREPTQAWS